MPVIIVGADTPLGRAIVGEVAPNAAELRTFISDPDAIDEFKRHNAKVAIGDVSDSSHIEGAAMRCFCAVLVVEAALDDRERSFAADAAAVTAGWAEAVRNAGVRRVIWVGRTDPLPSTVDEVVVIDPGTPTDTARKVAEAEEAASIR
jgi:putative NADH-flavin reductase